MTNDVNFAIVLSMEDNNPREFTAPPSSEPEYVGDEWAKIARAEDVDRQDGFTTEQQRSEWVALRDAEHALQAMREERADLIKRIKGGETIDSQQLNHIGELLLEAEADFQRLRQDQGLSPGQ